MTPTQKAEYRERKLALAEKIKEDFKEYLEQLEKENILRKRLPRTK